MPHHHCHDHGPANYNRAFAVGISLNLAFVVVETTFGIWGQSLALVADAAHNLSDVLSLVLAWGASLLAGRKPTEIRTYGFRRATILASLFSALLLLVALGAIAWEAFHRFSEPAPVAGLVIIAVSAIGVVINTATALLFVSGKNHDLNVKGAYLHMAADAAVSAGVVIAGIAILFTGWTWLDPTISLVIVGIILWGTWDLLAESIHLAVDGVPRDIDPSRVKSYLMDIPGVEALHDLHIWAMSTTETALTVHLVMPDRSFDDTTLHSVARDLHRRYGIDHTTIQVERGDSTDPCRLAPPDRV